MKLKKTLAMKLWDHKVMEKSMMPYDSSKIKFHDQMDMFLRASDAKRPKELGSPKQRAKRQVATKREPVLSQCESRMNENQKRRTQMLFFKRLEIDGAQIIVSQQDRDLFRNFGAEEEGEAEDELETAMRDDH
jgi:hypothetical protein